MLIGKGDPDLRDNSLLIRLSQDVVAPESTTATTPARPTQTETLDRVLTRKRSHTAFYHFKTANRHQMPPCSTKTQLKKIQLEVWTNLTFYEATNNKTYG